MDLLGRTTERDEQKAAAYGDWVRQRHPLAIASLVLGIFSLIEFGVLIVFGIAGIVLGIVALKQLRATPRADATPGPTRGHRLAWAGIILSVLSLILAGVVYWWSAKAVGP